MSHLLEKVDMLLAYCEQMEVYHDRILRASRFWSDYAGMRKSSFTPLYDEFRKTLVKMREDAGLTQRELAAKVGREHSFIGRIELGERRLDVVEFFWLCRACGCDPEEVGRDLLRRFSRMEKE